MTLPRQTDVLIVGAGPTGLALATFLSAAGIDTVVVDRAARSSADSGRNSRAAILHLRALELLDGLEVGEALAALGTPISTVAYFDWGINVCDLDFATMGSTKAYALGISQHHVEQVLTQRLESLGGSVHRGCTLEDIEQDEKGVLATVVGKRGGQNKISARFLVGCDGAHSTVRDLCTGMASIGVELADSYVIADAPIRGEFEPQTMHFYAANGGLAVVSPLPDGLWRLTATMSHKNREPSREELQLILNERGPRTSSVEVGPPVSISGYRIRRMVAPSLRDGRVLLAGDAAHTFSPVTAQGMNTGIADAANLAWKLVAVLKDVGQESLLDSYDVERRQAALDAAKRSEYYASALSNTNSLSRVFRDSLGLIFGRTEKLQLPMTESLAGFDTHYEKGLIGPSRHVAGWGEVGKRVEKLPPAMRGCSTFRLLGHKHSLTGQLKTLLSRWPEKIDVGALPSGGKGFVLVRPDDHIAWLGNESKLPELRSLLDKWFVVR
jgi:2-polyprenyl-6-methoxyphenol hydroxylase-like FAD-dependent oxidoreductase